MPDPLKRESAVANDTPWDDLWAQACRRAGPYWDIMSENGKREYAEICRAYMPATKGDIARLEEKIDALAAMIAAHMREGK